MKGDVIGTGFFNRMMIISLVQRLIRFDGDLNRSKLVSKSDISYHKSAVREIKNWYDHKSKLNFGKIQKTAC